MKRACLILLVVAAVFALGSCDWFGSDLSPDEVNAALAVAATQTGSYIPMSVHALRSGGVVPRLVGDTAVINGSGDGTATYVFTYGEPITGTITFDDFVFTVGSGDEYVLDGSVVLTLDFHNYPDFTATFSGTLSIEKNGSAAREYEIDLTQVIEVERIWGDDSVTVTLAVTTTGTINGESAAGTREFSYTWPIPIGIPT